MIVRDPWRWGTGPRGRRFSYPVQDQAIRVLESERRLCKEKSSDPIGSALSHGRLGWGELGIEDGFWMVGAGCGRVAYS